MATNKKKELENIEKLKQKREKLEEVLESKLSNIYKNSEKIVASKKKKK